MSAVDFIQITQQYTKHLYSQTYFYRKQQTAFIQLKWRQMLSQIKFPCIK